MWAKVIPEEELSEEEKQILLCIYNDFSEEDFKNGIINLIFKK